MPTRVYTPSPLSPDSRVELEIKSANHCLKVLRLREDAPLVLFNGDGSEYQAALKLDGKRAFAQIHGKQTIQNESPLRLHLGQGLARNDRMDWIVQKAVECGVHEFTPLICEKSLVKLKTDRLDNKIAHWQSIIQSACEQSGRNILPTLNDPVRLEDWLHNVQGPTVCFAPNAPQGIKSISKTAQLNVLLGPESGFSANEMNVIGKSVAHLCHLGPRVLRTETATVAALSAVQTVLGDFA